MIRGWWFLLDYQTSTNGSERFNVFKEQKLQNIAKFNSRWCALTQNTHMNTHQNHTQKTRHITSHGETHVCIDRERSSLSFGMYTVLKYSSRYCTCGECRWVVGAIDVLNGQVMSDVRISHGECEWVVSHRNTSCHEKWVMSHMNEYTYETNKPHVAHRVMSHMTYETNTPRVNTSLHMWMNQITCKRIIWQKNNLCHMKMSYVIYNRVIHDIETHLLKTCVPNVAYMEVQISSICFKYMNVNTHGYIYVYICTHHV